MIQEGIILKKLSIVLEKIPQDTTLRRTLQHMIRKAENIDWSVLCTPRLRNNGGKCNFFNDYVYFPLDALSICTDDELCKLVYASKLMMESSVEELFDHDPCFRLIKKISNSMRKWSDSNGTWNEIVDAYENFRKFELQEMGADFDVRLDHATFCNEYGHSQYTRTYLDGAFGLIIYYKKKHVMTIGFSILSDRRILLQQVQLKSAKNNRWIYKLPCDRVAYAILLFQRNFAGYELYIADGRDLADRSIRSFEKELDYGQKYHDYDLIGRASEIIRNLEADKERLSRAYADVGENRRIANDVITKHCVRHYRVCASAKCVNAP